MGATVSVAGDPEGGNVDAVAAALYARLKSAAAAEPAPFGYAVVELDATGKHPEPFGPTTVMLIVDPDLESARRKRDHMPASYRDRYVVCKLVPVEGEVGA